MDRGYLTLFHVRGVPVRAHWSLPILPILITWGRLELGTWLGVLVLIFLHELGHAALVWRFRLAVMSIDISGFGGACRWVGHPSEVQRSAIAWGGVLAQAIVFVIAYVLIAILGAPRHAFLAELAYAFVYANAWIMVLNLIPFPPLDGAEAWPFFKHAWRAWQRRREWRKRVGATKKKPGRTGRPQTLREALDEADDPSRLN